MGRGRAKVGVDRYILDKDGNPVACADLLEWGAWMELPWDETGRRVARTTIWEPSREPTIPESIRWPDIEVSSVFLGLDHSYYESSDPVLYESMGFGLGDFQPQERSTSRMGCLLQHEILTMKMIEMINGKRLHLRKTVTSFEILDLPSRTDYGWWVEDGSSLRPDGLTGYSEVCRVPDHLIPKS